jgi:acylpyruvate hydrolase
MKLATLRTSNTTTAVRVEPDHLVEINSPDVGTLLASPDWRTIAEDARGREHSADAARFAPLVPSPSKVLCVGLNYRTHILEMGRELPDAPTLFAKFSGALIGATDDIELPSVSDEVDWEAELAVVIGRTVRRVSPEHAASAIAGFSILNDVTVRDWQYRTTQWLQGKTFESTTPLGPYLVTSDDDAIAGLDGLDLSCEVDGDVVQSANTRDLVFGPADLVGYISTILTLVPGDVISTGTPGGVGHARKPPRYLHVGSRLTTRIQGLGECNNRCVAG